LIPARNSHPPRSTPDFSSHQVLNLTSGRMLGQSRQKLATLRKVATKPISQNQVFGVTSQTARFPCSGQGNHATPGANTQDFPFCHASIITHGWHRVCDSTRQRYQGLYRAGQPPHASAVVRQAASGSFRHPGN
jgi:hypothetical protein